MDVATLGLDVESGPLRRGERDMQSFARAGQQAGRQTENAMGRVNRSARAAAAGIAAATAAVAVLAGSVRVLAEFDGAMAQVSAITRATTSELEEMRRVAANLGSTTEFTAAQAAGGLRFLGMAGFEASEAIAAIPAVLDLATAASMDLAAAADTASNIMSAFGIAAENAADVSDVLAAASSRANTDVAQLGTAMAFVGPVASALDISLSDAAAAIGVLSDAGIQGSAAGTGLRRVLSSLANPTGAAATALQGLGVELESVNPATNDLTDIVDILADAGLSAADALTIFGDRGGPAILAVVSQNDRLRELTGELGNVKGEASRMADIFRDQLGGDLQSLWSSVQGLIIALGDAGLTAVLRGVIQLATGLVRSFVSAAEAVGQVTNAIGSFLRQQTALENVQRAHDSVTMAINDEIEAIRNLTIAQNEGGRVSLSVATNLLAEAEGRLRNADAARQQAQAIVDVAVAELEVRRVRRMEVLDAIREGTDAYEEQERAVVRIITRQQELRATTQGSTEAYQEAVAEVERIREAIANAEDGMVVLNGETFTTVELGERLSAILGSMDMSNAIAGAQALAQNLGVSLSLAQALALTGVAAGPDALDPRGGPSSVSAAQGAANYTAQIQQLRDSLADVTTTASSFELALDDVTAATSGGGGGGGGAAGAAEELAEELENAITPAEAFADAMGETTMSAVDMAREFAGNLQNAIGGVAKAFGDFVARGFRDFQGFVQSVLQSFRQMISQMIATAAQNQIMIGLGFGGGSGGGIGNIAGALGGGGSGGGILGGLGSILGTFGGKTGILGGMGSTIGGLFGGAGFGGLTSALSGGLATAIGGLIPVVGAAALIFTAFKGKTKELDSGLQVTVDGMDALIETFKTVEKSKFFGLIKNTSTSTSEASAGVAEPLMQVIEQIQNGVLEAAASLGVAEIVFADFAHQVQVSTAGMSEQEAVAAVQAELESLGDNFAEMVPGLEAVALEGEGAMTTLTRISEHLGGVNAAFDMLGLNLFDVSVQGAAAASSFVEMFGSLENFNAAAQEYYRLFYTEAERADLATQSLTETLAELGISALPESLAQFRMLVDAAREAGDDELLATLLQIAPAFAEIENAANAMLESSLAAAEQAVASTQAAVQAAYDAAVSAVESERRELIAEWQSVLDEAVEATRAAQERVSDALSAANTIFDAMMGAIRDAAGFIIDVIDEQIEAEKAGLESFQDMMQGQADAARDAFETLSGGLSDLIDAAQEAARETGRALDIINRALAARTDIQTQAMQRSRALAFVRAGDVSDQDRLSQALGVLNQDSRGMFSDRASFQLDYARTTNAIANLRDDTAATLSVEERMLRTLQDQLEAAEIAHSAHMRSMQDQLDAAQAATDAEIERLEAQIASVEAAADAEVGAIQAMADTLDTSLQDAIAAIFGSGATLNASVHGTAGAINNSLRGVNSSVHGTAGMLNSSLRGVNSSVHGTAGMLNHTLHGVNSSVHGTAGMLNSSLRGVAGSIVRGDSTLYGAMQGAIGAISRGDATLSSVIGTGNAALNSTLHGTAGVIANGDRMINSALWRAIGTISNGDHRLSAVIGMGDRGTQAILNHVNAAIAGLTTAEENEATVTANVDREIAAINAAADRQLAQLRNMVEGIDGVRVGVVSLSEAIENVRRAVSASGENVWQNTVLGMFEDWQAAGYGGFESFANEMFYGIADPFSSEAMARGIENGWLNTDALRAPPSQTSRSAPSTGMNDALLDMLIKVERNTRDSAKILRKQEAIGLPATRT